MKGFPKPAGFKCTTKSCPGHSFPSAKGFTGSTGKTRSVRGYTQAVPKAVKLAKGGKFKSPTVQKGDLRRSNSGLIARTQPVSQMDKESGGKSPLRPGYKKGGMKKDCYADGGGVLGSQLVPPGAMPYDTMTLPARSTVGMAGPSRLGGTQTPYPGNRIGATMPRAPAAPLGATPRPGYGAFRRGPMIK